jgi:hypothetical protein
VATTTTDADGLTSAAAGSDQGLRLETLRNQTLQAGSGLTGTIDDLTNPLPYWSFQSVSGTAVTADFDSTTLGGVKFSMAAGAAGDEAYIEQIVEYKPTRTQQVGLGLSIAAVRDNATANLMKVYLQLDLLDVDGNVVFTFAGPHPDAGVPGATTAELPDPTSYTNPTRIGVLGLGSGPSAQIVALRVRIGFRRDAEADGSTGIVYVGDVVLGDAQEVMLVRDHLSGSAGRIYKFNNVLYIRSGIADWDEVPPASLTEGVYVALDPGAGIGDVTSTAGFGLWDGAALSWRVLTLEDLHNTNVQPTTTRVPIFAGYEKLVSEPYVVPDGTVLDIADGGFMFLGVGNFNPEARGMLKPWSGSVATIPGGYLLCDGSRFTPNLADTFVVASSAGPSSGGTISPTAALTGHTDHGVTQPSAHSNHAALSNHAVTQPAAHSNHGVTQPSAHSNHAALSNHAVTQPAAHSNHGVTQPAAHSNHAVTQPSAHSNHSALGNHAALATHTHTGPSHTHAGSSHTHDLSVHQHELPISSGSSILRKLSATNYGTGTSKAVVEYYTRTAADTASYVTMLSDQVYGPTGTNTDSGTGGTTGAGGTGASGATSGGTPDAHDAISAHSAHSGTAIDAHSAHSGTAVDAHSAHSGTAVDAHSAIDAHSAHSGTAVDAHSAHSGTAVDAHSAIDAHSAHSGTAVDAHSAHPIFSYYAFAWVMRN